MCVVVNCSFSLGQDRVELIWVKKYALHVLTAFFEILRVGIVNLVNTKRNKAPDMLT